jgi:chromosome segregation ATPase
MVNIPALLFLFLLQFLLMFLGLAVFLFIRHRKMNIKLVISQGEIRRLESEIQKHKEEVNGLLGFQKMFQDLQQKFDQIQGVNTKLREAVEVLVPEAERSKEFAELISQIDSHNKELNTCIGTLQTENDSLTERMKSFQTEVDGLSDKLRESVNKEEHQRVLNEKERLERKVGNLKAEIDKKTGEYDKLEKNYMHLEKEYNALYMNIKGEVPS